MDNNDKPRIIESMDIKSINMNADGTAGIRGIVNEAIQKASQGDMEGAMDIIHTSAPGNVGKRPPTRISIEEVAGKPIKED